MKSSAVYSYFCRVPLRVETFLKQQFIDTEKEEIVCSGSFVSKNRY